MSCWKKEGRAEGRKEAIASVVLTMKNNDLSAEQIAVFTGSSIEDIKELYGTVK